MAAKGRERIVDMAIELFYTHGFNAVGLDQVLAEVGVTKTTFYKHFESKDDLILAAVKKRDAWELAAWKRAVANIAGDDPRDQLVGLFDVLDIWFNAPDYKGCMFINTAAEFPNPADPIHQAAASHKQANRDLFRDMAVGAGMAEADAETFADLFTMLFEGALILRHVHDRNDAAALARPQVERLVEQFLARAS